MAEQLISNQLVEVIYLILLILNVRNHLLLFDEHLGFVFRIYLITPI
tara:strand:+ start:8 stop:148 length:141 start_codon:yes stop_codon:yes gene_type:complete